jgi:NodT family efflux transporter outer membrane factor (OMF) lipoprotein
MMGLSSCINYVGIKSCSKPYSSCDLSIHRTYRIPPKTACIRWWKKFNDTQLNQLVEIALIDSPNLKIAENRLRRANELTKLAKSSLWPSIDLSGYVERERFATFGLIPPPFNGKTFNIYELGLNFNYEIDFFNKNRSIIAASVSEECATYQDLLEARLILSTSIAATYFQLQSYSAQIKIAREIVRDKQKLFNIVRYRAKRGIESDIPVKTAEAELQSAILSLEQYKEAYSIWRNQLVVLIGKNPLTTTIELLPFNYHHYCLDLPANLPANLLGLRPDVAASRYHVEAYVHEINVAKAAFFPNINLQGLFSYQSINFGKFFDPKSQNNAIAAAFDLPIFDANARRANLGVKYAEYDQAVNTYNQTILTALREVFDQLAVLRSTRSQLTTQDQATLATENNYKLIHSRYNHGIVDYVQVLEINGRLLQQKAIQVELQTRHLKAIIAMYKALGGYGQG